MKKNILIFPIETGIGLEIFNSLKNNKYYNIIGATSSVDFTYGDIILGYSNVLPFVNDVFFIEKLNAFIDKNNIDFIFPAHDDVLLYLSQNASNISAKIVAHSKETTYITRFKDKTYLELSEQDFIPILYSFDETISLFPVFCKPKCGQGSKDTFKIECENDLKHFLNIYDKKDFIVTEFLPGDEYTIDCVSANDNVLFCGGRVRAKTINGISSLSRPVINSEFDRIANCLQKQFDFSGAWFFQLKKDKYNKLKLLEIGSRISGTMGTYRALGVNFCELFLLIKQGVPISILKNNINIITSKVLFPKYHFDNFYFENLYVDLDDTLLVNNKINTDIIKLIYQSINLDKNIYLITKSSLSIEDLVELLKRYKVYALFDKIIHINSDDKKKKYIKPISILVDDSFSERNDCADIDNNIYVFSVDGACCLASDSA